MGESNGIRALGGGVSRAGTGNLRQRHRKWWLGYILLQFVLTAERAFLLSEGPPCSDWQGPG